MGFVQLHVHSEYSFLDSLLKVEEIVKFASEHSRIACISDHGYITAFVDAEGRRLPRYYCL